jgi:saccharopine dehydrogenase (NAD+, L-glutamate forming)
MKTVLQFGAGKSAIAIIEYLLKYATELDIKLIVFDQNISSVKPYLNNERLEAIEGNIFDDEKRKTYIENATCVISMLPARFHLIVAKDCLEFSKSLFTASYLSSEIIQFDESAKRKNILFLNEIGLDPGIDHMSAMQIIDEVHDKGGKFESFKSFCGGLVADAYDNEWRYKFTWNPRNVVLSGQGVAKFLEKGQYKYIPYQQLFLRKESMNILDFGQFEAYANRDSLGYKKHYQLEYIDTMFRGTLRKDGYLDFWNTFVQLGMTEDSYELENLEGMTYRDFTNTFLPYSETLSVEEKFEKHINQPLSKYENLGLFSDQKIELENGSPAKVLQEILVKKWSLNQEDKDLVVMQHQFEYTLDGKNYKLRSSFGLEGSDPVHTAMATTVGLPLVMAVKRYLQGKINLTGVHIPVQKEIYQPILEELKEYKISFTEELETC